MEHYKLFLGETVRFIRLFIHAKFNSEDSPSRRLLSTGAILLALLLMGGGGQAFAADDAAVAAAAEQAAAEARQAEENIQRLLSLLEKEQDNQPVLEELAAAYYRNGNYRSADLTYTRLLKIHLDNPALALPYAMSKWHLRQEYEAQATMIRSLRTVKLSPGNVTQLQTTLAECYAPESIIEALKPEFPGEEELRALERLAAHIQEILTETRRLETSRDALGLAKHIRRYFDGRDSTRAFYALWRYFTLVYANDLDGAEMELRLAVPAVKDPRLDADILTATNLLVEARKAPDSSELMNTVSDFLSNVSSAIGVPTSDAQIAVSTLLNDAWEMIQQRQFAEALSTLEKARPLLAKNEDRIRYLFFHAEALWPLAEYTRAYQAYVASSILLRDRYFLSTAIFRMAEYAAMLHKRDDAALYALRSASVLRENSWVLRRTGVLLLNIDMTERGLAYLERALEMSDTLQSDADSYAELADAYKRIGERDRYLEYARHYEETIDRIVSQGGEVTDNQKGLADYFRGEILASEEKYKEAYDSYELASTLLTDTYRLAEAYSVMAEYQATAGNADEAESLAERSAELLPGEAWKARQVGGLLVRLGKRDRAVHYLEKALELSFSVRERAYSYASLADAYRTWQDNRQFLRYAQEYIDLVKLHRDQLTDAEEGFAAFFQGEIYNYQGSGDLAYREFERATELLDDRFRRAEAWMRMAEYQAAAGAFEQATTLADKSADEISDQGWKMQLVGQFFMQHGLYGKAEEYYRRYARMSAPDDPLAYYGIIADAYREANLQELYLRAAGEYVEAATADGRVPSREEAALVAYYRGEGHFARGEMDQAYALYDQASAVISDKAVLSDIYWKMAQIESRRGNEENAANLAEKSAEMLPDDDKKARQVADFLLALKMPERARTYIDRYTVATSGEENTLSAYSALAESRKNMGDRREYLYFAKEFIAAFDADSDPHSPAEKGLAAYYRGDILADQSKPDEAYASYEIASQFIEDKNRLSEIYMNMARLQAERKNLDAAAKLAADAADALPEFGYAQLQTGDFLASLDMPGKALDYYSRYVELSSTPNAKLFAYQRIVESTKRAQDWDNYRLYAGKYVELAANTENLGLEQRGWAVFFQAELHNLDGERNEAYLEYGKAVELITEKYLLSEILMKMAEIDADRGNQQKAAERAEQALALLPDQLWKIRQTADLYVRLGMPDNALALYERRLPAAETPRDKATLYSYLADMARMLGDREKFLHYGGEYAALASAPDFHPTAEEDGLRHYYQAENHAAANRNDQALAEYEQATLFLANKQLLAESFLRMGEITAGGNDSDKAVEYVKKAVATLPDEYWVMQRAADIYLQLGMPEEAIELYDRRLLKSSSPKEEAQINLLMAQAYGRMGKQDEYIEKLARHIELLSSIESSLKGEELGLLHYYRGEHYRALDMNVEALAEYRRASELLTTNYYLSEAAMRMAEIEADNDNNELAEALAARSLELLREDWKISSVAAFFNRLGRNEKAASLYLEKLGFADTPKKKSDSYRELAEFYKSTGDMKESRLYAEKYVELILDENYASTSDEKALAYLYMGEKLNREKNYDRALQAARQAADLSSSKQVKFDALLLLAEIYGKKENIAEATRYAVQAGDLFSDDPWQQRKIGDLFSNLDQMDKAMSYYRRFLELGKNENDRAMAYSTIADAYKKMGEYEEYLEYAQLYANTVSALGDKATRDQKGMRAYYYGEIKTAEKNPDEAYRSYSTATEYLTDKYRLSEIYAKMARHNITVRNRDLAKTQALHAADLMPADYWRVKDAADLLLDLKEFDSAVQVIDRAMALNSEVNPDFYLLLSTIHQRAKQRKSAVTTSRSYIDSLLDEMEDTGARTTHDQHVKLWEARKRHGELTRILPAMSFEGVYGGTEHRGDDFYRNLKFEFNRYFYVNRFLQGSFYAILEGNTDGYSSGTYMDSVGSEQIWENYPEWRDTHELRVGLSLKPFPGVFNSLSVKAEQVFGLGQLKDNDFRFILNYDRSSDDTPKLFERVWPYWKIWMDLPYSTRKEDINFLGSFKRGASVAAPWDRNLIINAYGMATYSYLGRHLDPSVQWGAEAGIGMDLKKYIGETKYRTAMESVEVSVYYLWALTDSRQDGLGFTFTVKF